MIKTPGTFKKTDYTQNMRYFLLNNFFLNVILESIFFFSKMPCYIYYVNFLFIFSKLSRIEDDIFPELSIF